MRVRAHLLIQRLFSFPSFLKSESSIPINPRHYSFYLTGDKMGKRFSNKRGGKNKERKGGRNFRRPGKPINYADIVKENDTYVEYYKAQKIVPPEEWDDFMAAIRDELPSAFRINRCCLGQTLKLRDMINGDFFGEIVNPDGKKMAAVAPLPWDKEGLSFQFNYSRVEIRKSEALQRLHSFLVSESETGYITRQEAVSMIPPLVLDIQPHHKVLDTCAAPGSKTAQIIEMLEVNQLDSESKNQDSSLISTGMVVANDVDNKRCYMLVHQAKRLHSPCFIICNHDAGGMPNFYTEANGSKTKIKFDRILCDAPCTGDGTIRKNIDVWTKWTIPNGNNFHNIQLRIARRSLEMLAKDGKMVYSTCSLNPVEDEAVVASLLAQCEGTVELVDVADRLPGLRYLPGLSTWVVMQRDMKVVNSFAEVEENYKPQIRETMFPPKNAEDLNLQRCLRILPHYQNTGGFFVAVFRKKVDYLPWEKKQDVTSNIDSENVKIEADEEPAPEEVQKPERPVKKPRRANGFREDPFYFLSEDAEEWIEIKKFFKISDAFPVNQLVARSKGAKRNIYFVTSSARDIIMNNETNVKFINGGVRLFSRADDKVCDVGYRIAQEGLASIYPYLDKNNMVPLSAPELALLMSQDMTNSEELEKATQEKLSTLPSGCQVAVFREKLTSKSPTGEAIDHEMVIPLCLWKGKTTVRPFVSKTERIHFLRMCGGDTKELEAEELKRFQEKQERKQARIDERNQQLAEEEKSKESNVI